MHTIIGNVCRIIKSVLILILTGVVADLINYDVNFMTST